MPKQTSPRRQPFHKKIAGHVFGLENRYPEVEKTCRKYICHEQPEAVFSVSQQTYFPSTLVCDREGEKSASAFQLRLKTLDLMGKLSRLPIYELHCTISQEAVDLTLNALLENTPK